MCSEETQKFMFYMGLPMQFIKEYFNLSEYGMHIVAQIFSSMAYLIRWDCLRIYCRLHIHFWLNTR